MDPELIAIFGCAFISVGVIVAAWTVMNLQLDFAAAYWLAIGTTLLIVARVKNRSN